MISARIVDIVLEQQPDRVLVARALEPELRDELAWAISGEELPFVRGRTVVPDDLGDEDIVVAGHPNHLGVFDLPATPRWIAVGGTGSTLREAEGAMATVDLQAPVPVTVAIQRHRDAVELAKRLDQLPGVTVAFPPQSPVVVALTPADPRALVSDLGMSGISALTDYEELPGAIRIEPTSEFDAAQYAAALERTL